MLLALLFVHLIKSLLQLRQPCRIVANRPFADRTGEVVIESEGGLPINFLAGQFAWLNLGHAPFSLAEHPCSIDSAPESVVFIAGGVGVAPDVNSATRFGG